MILPGRRLNFAPISNVSVIALHYEIANDYCVLMM